MLKTVSGEGVLSRRASTIVVTTAKVAVQALFLLVLPKFVATAVASETFLAFAASIIVVPTCALGSQFALIRRLSGQASRTDNPSSYYLGFAICAASAAIVSSIYAHGSTPIAAGALCIIFLCNYVRLFGDSFAQGTGRYNLSQLAYVMFWCVKLGAVAIGAKTGHAFSFMGLALLEVVVSLPWLGLLIIQLRRLKIHPSLNASWGHEFAIVAAGLVRSFWLECDKLLLPLLVSATSYVDYTLVSRAATGALSLVASYLGVVTPRIVQAKPLQLSNIVREGRPITAISMLGCILATMVVIWQYPSLSAQYRIVGFAAISLPALHLWSSTYADFVFYHRGPTRRLAINTSAAILTAAAALVGGWTGQIWLAPLGLILGYLVCGKMSVRMARSEVIS